MLPLLCFRLAVKFSAALPSWAVLVSKHSTLQASCSTLPISQQMAAVL